MDKREPPLKDSVQDQILYTVQYCVFSSTTQQPLQTCTRSAEISLPQDGETKVRRRNQEGEAKVKAEE